MQWNYVQNFLYHMNILNDDEMSAARDKQSFVLTAQAVLTFINKDATVIFEIVLWSPKCPKILNTPMSQDIKTAN